MNLRGRLYDSYCLAKGSRLPVLHRQFVNEARAGVKIHAATQRLRSILLWSREHVPYYRRLLGRTSEMELSQDPQAALRSLPILTKDLIRANWDDLKSDDLARRRWYYNTSGGSTGEPVRLIQDQEFHDVSMAAANVYSSLIGREVGQPEVRLWGSERDILQGSERLRSRISNRLTRTHYLNAFRMTDSSMRGFVEKLNRVKPLLIVAYAQAAYELALFVERSGMKLHRQRALLTSAGTLYPFMRKKLEHVFGCPVFNRYGSREVGGIACEVPGGEGLWVAPWNTFVEILDDNGRDCPAGHDGNILVTCLSNLAMPLLRYAIGDVGSLRPAADATACQVLERVAGRNVDMFKTATGALVDGEYFTHLLYFRNWVNQFQVVQNSVDKITWRIVGQRPNPSELDDITRSCREVMGPRCEVTYDFVESIPHGASGKFRYTISEVR